MSGSDAMNSEDSVDGGVSLNSKNAVISDNSVDGKNAVISDDSVDGQDVLVDDYEAGSYFSDSDDGFTTGDSWNGPDSDNEGDNSAIVIDSDDEVAVVRSTLKTYSNICIYCQTGDKVHWRTGSELHTFHGKGLLREMELINLTFFFEGQCREAAISFVLHNVLPYIFAPFAPSEPSRAA